MTKDWVVSRYGLTEYGKKYGTGNVPYPYWVAGLNLNDDRPFFWIVPDITNERYDMTNAVLCDSIDFNYEKRLIIL